MKRSTISIRPNLTHPDASPTRSIITRDNQVIGHINLPFPIRVANSDQSFPAFEGTFYIYVKGMPEATVVTTNYNDVLKAIRKLFR